MTRLDRAKARTNRTLRTLFGPMFEAARAARGCDCGCREHIPTDACWCGPWLGKACCVCGGPEAEDPECGYCGGCGVVPLDDGDIPYPAGGSELRYIMHQDV